MDTGVLQEALADTRELISDTWHFFLTVHMAILAIVYVAQRRTRFPERIILLGAYLGFMGLNYLAQLDNYTRLIDIASVIERDSSEIAEATRVRGGETQVTAYLGYAYILTSFLSAAVIIFVNRSGGHHGR
jgi:hypothetical protein